MPARENVSWTESTLLSAASDGGSHEQKPLGGSGNKLVTVYLYYTPGPSSASESLMTPSSRSTAKTKSRIKAEPKVKEKNRSNVNLLPRPRANSAEMSFPTRIGVITRGQTQGLVKHEKLGEERRSGDEGDNNEIGEPEDSDNLADLPKKEEYDDDNEDEAEY